MKAAATAASAGQKYASVEDTLTAEDTDVVLEKCV